LGGKAEVSGTESSSETEDLYPSIRRLPILGITYADLYRRAKVEEVVYETLTKQYEMAKVEEARETPSVKVLDEGDIPERKSFPPRTLLMALGTLMVLACAAGWLLFSDRWQKVDPQHPGKALVAEILRTIADKLPWRSQAGASAKSIGGMVLRGFRWKNHEH
jgi:hypothetical protein